MEETGKIFRLGIPMGLFENKRMNRVIIIIVFIYMFFNSYSVIFFFFLFRFFSFFIYEFNFSIFFSLSLPGNICSGTCCTQTAENELIARASNNFDRMLRHHTRNLRSNLESTTKTFRGKLFINN